MRAFTEYALLAFWAVRAWRRARFPIVRNYRFILAVVLVLIIASTDEFDQSLEPSRTSLPGMSHWMFLAGPRWRSF